MTVQMNTNFLNAARPGDFLEVDVRVRKRSGSMLFMDAILTVGNREIATASCILKTVAMRLAEG